MCGRYAASADAELLEEIFVIDEVAGPLPPPRWNIAPTDPVIAVVERARRDEPDRVARKLVELRWGLVPSWSKGAKGAARMINARFETLAEKPAFRKALATRRCLLPADGYYEWYAQTVDESLPKSRRPPKQPFFIHPTDSSLLAMVAVRVLEEPRRRVAEQLHDYHHLRRGRRGPHYLEIDHKTPSESPFGWFVT